MKHKKLQDVLPKLGQMMAKDFREFGDKWEDVLKTYTEVFKWLNEVLWWKDESIETTAVQIIENYIKARKKGTIGNEWFPAYDWLAYELGEMFYEIMEGLRSEIYDPERDEDEEECPMEPLL
jgi:hypothetical protein